MKNRLDEYFKNALKTNRISHAFLICNTDFNNLKDELFEVLSNYFFENQIIDENFPDVEIIKPSNSKILKEDILDLQTKLKVKSQINKNRIYIIDNADLMNSYAGNSLLKFLEEPESDIYAFLLTSNINKIMPTIKSRCQIIMLENKNNIDLELNEEECNKIIDFIQLVESKKINSIAYVYDIIDKKEDKNFLGKLLQVMEFFYKDVLTYKLLNKVVYFPEKEILLKSISEKNEEKVIIKKLKTLNRLENELDNNLNLGLFIDRLLIELEMDCCE